MMLWVEDEQSLLSFGPSCDSVVSFVASSVSRQRRSGERGSILV